MLESDAFIGVISCFTMDYFIARSKMRRSLGILLSLETDFGAMSSTNDRLIFEPFVSVPMPSFSRRSFKPP
jgi:hypothetical protein